jgi:hypothetical protein
MARKFWPVLGLLGLVIAAGIAWAAAPGIINSYVGVCDPNFATHCIAPDASGNVPVTIASGGGNVNVAQFGGSNVVTGTGTGGAGIPRFTVSNDSTVGLVAGSAIVGKVGIDQTTPGTTNGVQVNAALPAGANAIGNVGGKTVSVCVTPTVTASNSYGTNYVVGGLLTFSNAFTSTGTGILQSVVVTVKKVETSGFTFYPFNSNPSNTTWTDAAVANINASDVAAVREPVALSAASGLGTHTVAWGTGLGEAFAPVATSMYGILLANAALTNQFGSTSDVQVCVKVLQDL